MQLSTFIGLRAIAWIITKGNEVIQYGIKRVNISFDHYYEYIAGQPVSKRINRRMKKQMRRHLWRRRSRRKNLMNTLNKHGYSCDGEMSRDELLQLRVKGLDKALTKEELYMVLMSLQQKRGYKRLRGAGNEDKIKSYSEEILKHNEKIEAKGSADAYMAKLFPNTTIRVEYNEQQLKKYRSIGEYLLTLSTSKDLIFNRSSYEKEFNAIMDNQGLKGSLRDKLFSIIYTQRPLKKSKISNCDYEPNRKVIHASSPMYQEFRIWRDVMNIALYDGNKTELDIPFDFRVKWVQKLMKGSNLTKSACCKDLGIKSSKEYTWYSGSVIAGNAYFGFLLKLDIFCDYQQLWEDLYSATDDDKLSTILRIKYGLSDMQVNELLDMDLHTLGYGDFSAKAIRKLLPIMQTGKKLKEAILEVYGVVDFKNVALRNVILEQHYHSYEALVDRLKKDYAIEEVKFEIDHLLKLGNKGRKELAKNKRKDEKWLKENAAVLAGKSSYDILKYKLWVESDGVSPYEPEKKISLKELFTKEYNIDHIVAKSTLFETGYQNMVLAPLVLNEKKDRMTGLDFAKSLGVETKYEAVVEKFPEGKKQFLKMAGSDLPTNWISKRQNSDYNTKCFATVGSDLSPTLSKGEGEKTKTQNGKLATNIPGKLINKFMNDWKLNSYKEDDARYYLCKAFIIANFSQNTVHYFDNIASQKSDYYKLFPDLPLIDFSNAPIFIPRVKFTRKTKFGYTPRFALHGESVYGERVEKSRNAKGEWVEKKYYKIRQGVGKLSANMVDNIMAGNIKRLVEQRIAKMGSHEEGIMSMVDDPILFNGKPVKSVSVRVNAQSIYPLHSTDGRGNTTSKGVHERKIDFVFSDKNHSVKLLMDEKGKLSKSVKTLMQHVDNLNDGYPFHSSGMDLHERDMVKIDEKVYFLVGAGEVPMVREIYALTATNSHTIKSAEWAKLKKLYVNQLGEVLGELTIDNGQLTIDNG